MKNREGFLITTEKDSMEQSDQVPRDVITNLGCVFYVLENPKI